MPSLPQAIRLVDRALRRSMTKQVHLRRQINIARGAADPPREFGGALGKASCPFVDHLFQTLIISADKGSLIWPKKSNASRTSHVVVVIYNIPREAPRTLHSLSAAYQRHIGSDDYEIIVVDNGSTPPVDPQMIAGLSGNFRLIRIDDAHPITGPSSQPRSGGSPGRRHWRNDRWRASCYSGASPFRAPGSSPLRQGSRSRRSDGISGQIFSGARWSRDMIALGKMLCS